MDQAEQLRNAVKNQNQKKKPSARMITVTSGKGGVGKSNISVNLAVQFQKMGKKTIIFDADIGLANVEVMFGTIPKYSLNDLIYHGKNIEEIVTEGPEGVGFVSGGSGLLGLSNISHTQLEHMVRAVAQLSTLADIVIIDTGAGISDSVMEFVAASPEILLVTTPDPTSLTDAYSLLKTLYRNPKYDKSEVTIHVLTNRVSSATEGQAVFEKLESVVRQFLDGSVNYLGMIPQDAMLEKSVRMQKPVSICYPDARASKRFEELAQKLLAYGQEEQETAQKPHSGMMRFLAKFFNL